MKEFSYHLNELIQEKIYELPGKKTRSGQKINVRCFICGDSSRDKNKRRGWFYLNNEPISYYCFNEDDCKCSGLRLLSNMMEITEKEASRLVFKRIKQYSNKETIIEEPTIIVEPKKEIREELDIPNYWVNLNDDCKKILIGRKILEAPFKPKKWKLYYSKPHKRIAIPWVDESNKIETFQYRAMYKDQSPKYMFKSNSEKSLFYGDFNHNLDFYCFCEGVFDSIFIENCIAVGGIFPNNSQLEELKNKHPFMYPIWVPDNPWKDSSSKAKIIKISESIPKLKIFKWDKECKYKDINEMIININNVNLFNKDFIKDNLIDCKRMAINLKFNKQI